MLLSMVCAVQLLKVRNICYAVRRILPAVDVAAATMEDGPREDGTKEEPDKFEEDETVSLEHISGVSLATDTTGLRDELVSEALAEFLAEFTNGGSVYRCEVCPVFLYFFSAKAFWKHFENEHVEDELQFKTDAAEYRAAHPGFRVDIAPKARCKACGTWLRRDEAKWSKHLRKAHAGMRLEEYFVRYEFVPESEEARATEEAESVEEMVNEAKDREEGGIVAGCSTREENAILSTPEPGTNTNGDDPTDDHSLEQDEVDDCYNGENQTTGEGSVTVMKIKEVRTIDPHEDDRDDFRDEVEVESEFVTEEHQIIIGPENPDTHILNQPFLNIIKLQEMRERYNLCLYECQLCFCHWDSIVGLVTHLNSRHEINIADHKAHYGEFRVMENYYFCKICCDSRFDLLGCNRDVTKPCCDSRFDLVGCDRDFTMSAFCRSHYPCQMYSDGHEIQLHLLHAHGLNLLQYDRIVRGEDLWFDTCVYRCRLCPSADTFAGIRKFETHFAAEHAGQKKKAAMAVVCKSNYECVICKKLVPGVPGVFDGHLSQQHGLAAVDYLELFLRTLLRPKAKVKRVEVNAVEVPEEWFNGCLFKCAICQAYLSGSGHLTRHVNDRHGLPFPLYR